MYDKAKIIILVGIFLSLLTFPFYYNIIQAAIYTPKPELSLDTPEIQQMKEKQCVKSVDYMSANHMKLLDYWRNSVVRDNDRYFGIIDGVKYEKSLQGTCMHCHSNKRNFCDRCHIYADVKVYCWDCHIAP